MGLYSKNRFSNLSADKIAEAKTMSESTILEAPDISEDNHTITFESFTSYFENCDTDINVFQTITQLQENRMTRFIESIDDEMQNIVNEALLISKKGKDPKSKLELINNQAKAGKEWIKNSAAQLHQKIEKMISKDSNKNELYIDAITKNPKDGYSGIEYFVFPTRTLCKEINSIMDSKKLVDYSRKVLREISNDADPTSLASYKDEVTVFIGAIEKDCGKKSKSIFKTNKTWKPNSADIAVLKSYANGDGRNILNDLAKTTIELEKDFDIISKLSIKTAQSIFNSKDYANVTPKKLQAVFDCLDLLLADIIYRFTIYRSLIVKEVAAYRKALFSYGRYCHKGGNSWFNNILGEAAELYVYETLDEKGER